MTLELLAAGTTLFAALGVVGCLLLATATARNGAHGFTFVFLALAILYAFPLALGAAVLAAGDLT